MSGGHRSGRAPRARPRTLAAVRARRQELSERAAAQREELARHLGGLAPALAAGDRLAAFGGWVRSHPVLVAAAAGVIVALWPRRVLALATRGLGLWQGAQAVRRMFAPHG